VIDTPQHRTIISTQTPPTRITVELAETTGRWHKVLDDLWDQGIIASLSDRSYRVLGAFCRLRHDDAPTTTHAPLGTLQTLTGRGKSFVYAGVSELIEHSAGLLARTGADLYHVLPLWQFAGRRLDSAIAEPFHDRGKLSAIAEKRVVAVRACAPSQPEEEPEELAWNQRGITKEATKRYMDARGRGMAGWTGYPLHWDLEGVTCPRLALGMLDLREPLRTKLLTDCPDITVGEIVRTFDQIRMGTNVKNPPMVLAHRLMKQRGRQLPKAAPVHDREALDFARAMEALRAGRRA